MRTAASTRAAQVEAPGLLAVAELVPGTVGAKATAAPGNPNPEAMPSFAASRDASLPSHPAVSMATLRAPSRPARVKPLSPGRYKVQFTASAGLHDKIERLTALMCSEVPNGDLGAIIELAVTEKLERLEARRFARTTAPRKTLADTDTAPTSRHIPAAVRRAVRKRDGGRCRFVDEQGRCCSERHRLEFHHRYPFGMGGDHSPGNIGLLCSQHNRLLAEYDYGQAAIQRHRTGGESPAPIEPATHRWAG